MEILRKLFITGITLVSFLPMLQAAEVRTGLTLERIYCENESGVDGCAVNEHLGTVITDMAVDPLSGNLFIGQSIEISGVCADDTRRNGNIMVLDPSSGQVQDMGMSLKCDDGSLSSVPYIPFYSRALDFTTDGTMYFGVSKSLLASWRRASESDSGVFRIFSSIPKIVDLEVSASDDVYVGVDNRGPESLHDNAVLLVDKSDGYFSPVVTFDELVAADVATGDISNLSRITVDAAGNFAIGYAKGETFIKQSNDGAISFINPRSGDVGGVNNTSLAATPNGMLLQVDSASGHIYAVLPDGTVTLAAYGDELKSVVNSDSAITTDGSVLYLVNANRAIYRLTTTASDLMTSISTSLGEGTVSGTATDAISGEPIEGVLVTLSNGVSTTSAANGQYSLAVSAGLYEVTLSLEGFNTVSESVNVENGGTVVADASFSDLPSYVAPGLEVDIVASQQQDGITRASDVTLDANGDLYAMNNSISSIIKIELDPVTRENVGSRTIAEGVGDGGAWFVTVDQSFNIFTSYGSAGVVMFKELAGDVVTLSPLGGDTSQIVDQNGTNRMISFVGDVDGGAVLSDGRFIFSSGSGAGPSANFPDGTFNTLVSHNNGSEAIYSQGLPAGGGEPVFSNNDLVKLDSEDRVLVTNAHGNLVRVSSNGDAELIWPGDDGDGGLESVGGYTNFSADMNGNMFARGSFSDAPTALEGGGSLRMISEDRTQFITAVAGVRSWSGVAWDPDGQTVFLANKHVIYKVSSIDDRTIAENLLDEAYVAPSFSANIGISDGGRPVEYDESGYENALISTHLFKSLETSQPETQSSGGGVISWLMIISALFWFRRRKVWS